MQTKFQLFFSFFWMFAFISKLGNTTVTDISHLKGPIPITISEAQQRRALLISPDRKLKTSTNLDEPNISALYGANYAYAKSFDRQIAATRCSRIHDFEFVIYNPSSGLYLSMQSGVVTFSRLSLDQPLTPEFFWCLEREDDLNNYQNEVRFNIQTLKDENGSARWKTNHQYRIIDTQSFTPLFAETTQHAITRWYINTMDYHSLKLTNELNTIETITDYILGFSGAKLVEKIKPTKFEQIITILSKLEKERIQHPGRIFKSHTTVSIGSLSIKIPQELNPSQWFEVQDYLSHIYSVETYHLGHLQTLLIKSARLGTDMQIETLKTMAKTTAKSTANTIFNPLSWLNMAGKKIVKIGVTLKDYFIPNWPASNGYFPERIEVIGNDLQLAVTTYIRRSSARSSNAIGSVKKSIGSALEMMTVLLMLSLLVLLLPARLQDILQQINTLIDTFAFTSQMESLIPGWEEMFRYVFRITTVCLSRFASANLQGRSAIAIMMDQILQLVVGIIVSISIFNILSTVNFENIQNGFLYLLIFWIVSKIVSVVLPFVSPQRSLPAAVSIAATAENDAYRWEEIGLRLHNNRHPTHVHLEKAIDVDISDLVDNYERNMIQRIASEGHRWSITAERNYGNSHHRKIADVVHYFIKEIHDKEHLSLQDLSPEGLQIFQEHLYHIRHLMYVRAIINKRRYRLWALLFFRIETVTREIDGGIVDQIQQQEVDQVVERSNRRVQQ